MESLARSAVFSKVSSEIIFRAGMYSSTVRVGCLYVFTCWCMSGASFVWRVTAVLLTNYQLHAKAALASFHCSFPQTVY